jgi:DNA polymerase IV
MAEATASTQAILGTARGLLAEAGPTIEKRGITLIGLALANLDDDTPMQLPLPFAGADGALDAALDNLRDRFGSGAITRAVLLGRDEGFSVPLLPD